MYTNLVQSKKYFILVILWNAVEKYFENNVIIILRVIRKKVRSKKIFINNMQKIEKGMNRSITF